MLQKRKPINFQRYILTFFITAMIFALGFFASDYIDDKRFSEINTMKQGFQMQILALETQLDHFKDILCADVGDDILTHELHLIGEKLQFMKNNLGQDHPEVIHIKKYYSLLQIRHYQLSKQLSQRCNLGLVHVLYFFADQKYCPDCEKQGHILSYLRKAYPLLRIYSFDYILELPALAVVKPLSVPPSGPETKNEHPEQDGIDLRPSKPLPDTQKDYLPIIVIEGKPFYGFKNIQELREILPKRVFF